MWIARTWTARQGAEGAEAVPVRRVPGEPMPLPEFAPDGACSFIPSRMDWVVC